jgi:hypothetical protein
MMLSYSCTKSEADSSVQFSFVLHPWSANNSHWMGHFSVVAISCGEVEAMPNGNHSVETVNKQPYFYGSCGWYAHQWLLSLASKSTVAMQPQLSKHSLGLTANHMAVNPPSLGLPHYASHPISKHSIHSVVPGNTLTDVSVKRPAMAQTSLHAWQNTSQGAIMANHRSTAKESCKSSFALMDPI